MSDQHDRGGIAHREQQRDDQRGHLSTVTAWERTYFVAVGVLAATVGFPAYLTPKNVDSVLPFGVPPLHSRLIGAIYLSGLAIFVGGVLARWWVEIRVIPALTAIWTGGLLLITLLHHEDFDFGKTQTQIWFGAYVAYPIIGIWILVARRGEASAFEAGPPPAAWTRWCLIVQGAVLSAAGLALVLAPGTMADGWPWPVDSLLAQIYSAPILAYGVASLLLLRARSWPEMRIVVVGIGLFAVGALVGAVIHLELFEADDPAAWAWFAALAGLTAVAAVLVATRGGRHEQR